ncbi:MAG: hypothetical protein OXT72_02090 [Gammaproteobacteria bacterium]|nr:hypothetical protein [Gammaproteobacteria bacterium]MDE0246702.1 hypothetical protein [Gammaproteobacteria bacterium]
MVLDTARPTRSANAIRVSVGSALRQSTVRSRADFWIVADDFWVVFWVVALQFWVVAAGVFSAAFRRTATSAA